MGFDIEFFDYDFLLLLLSSNEIVLFYKQLIYVFISAINALNNKRLISRPIKPESVLPSLRLKDPASILDTY
jgi:hypothetical protein